MGTYFPWLILQSLTHLYLLTNKIFQSFLVPQATISLSDVMQPPFDGSCSPAHPFILDRVAFAG
jgi:hypothetical protein